MTFPIYGQRDYPQHLGLPQADKGSTIAHYGCRLTSFGMIVGWTPDKLQQAFCAPDQLTGEPVFIASGSYNFFDDTRACSLFPQTLKNNPAGRVDCISTPAPLDKLDALLERNGFALCYVDATYNMKPAPHDKFREHWILVIRRYDDPSVAGGVNYEIRDPWEKDSGPLVPRYTTENGTAQQAICGWVEIDLVTPLMPAPVTPLDPAIATRIIEAEAEQATLHNGGMPV